MSDSKGSIITFQNIKYFVKQKLDKPCKAKNDKMILNGVSGIFKPGLNALMGPTGSGKTSLLDVLAGRKDPRFKSGIVLIDGLLQPTNFKCISGYVLQEDNLFGSMTVKENIRFAAYLKLPSGTSRKIRETRISEVITQLKLENCADTYIGTDFLRGVSGGECKRTAIGMALVNSPPVLFLDEPTTGLDAHTAFLVMNLLHQLGKSGHTIICSIHQPRYSIFKLFDSIIGLKMGGVIFQGHIEEIIPYFSNLGNEIEPNDNPADFLIDVITIHAEKNAIQNSDSYFTDKYKESELYTKINDEVTEIVQKFEADGSKKSIYSKETYASYFIMQLYALGYRSFLETIRDPKICMIEIVVSICIGIIIGIVFFQLKDDYKTGIKNRLGVALFFSLQLVFKNLAAIPVFYNNRILFINENTGGYYRTSSYFITKSTFDLLIMRLIPTLIFGVISYWMVGFEPDVNKFMMFLLNMILTTFSGAILVMFMASTFQKLPVIQISTMLVMVIMMVFCGALVNLTTISYCLKWIKYISIIYYTLSIFLVLELKDKAFCRKYNETSCSFGNKYLSDHNIPYMTDWDLWFLYLCNFTIYMVLNILTYIKLRRLNRYK